MSGCRPGNNVPVGIFVDDHRMIGDLFIYFRNPIFVKNPMVVKMNGTEQDFVHRINVKEEAAFHDLFTRFRNYLVLFAIRRIDQLDVAEDIVQETLLPCGRIKKIQFLSRFESVFV